jgi:hypothetical protein
MIRINIKYYSRRNDPFFSSHYFHLLNNKITVPLQLHRSLHIIDVEVVEAVVLIIKNDEGSSFVVVVVMINYLEFFFFPSPCVLLYYYYY